VPSLHQIPNSPYWYAAYRLASGTRVLRSTQETDRSRAKIKLQAMTAIEEEAARADTDRKFFDRIVEDALRRLGYATNPEPTVGEWLGEWLTLQRNTVTDKTLGKYSLVVREFLASLGPKSTVRLSKITEHDFNKFRDDLLRSGRSPSTVNLMVRVILKLPFTHAINSGKLIRNPLNLVKQIKAKASVKSTFTLEQVKALLISVNSDSDWRGMILCSFYTGMRLSDIQSLKWKNLDLDGEIPTISFFQKKAGGQVIIPIHPQLLEFFRGRGPRSKTEGYFEIFWSKSARTTQHLSQQFGDLMEKAGIEREVLRRGEGKGRRVHSLSFHSFRHTFTSFLFNAGIPSEVRQKLTGHGVTRDSHSRYTHAQLETLRNAINVLPKLE